VKGLVTCPVESY